MPKFMNSDNNQTEWKAIKEFTDRAEPRKVFWEKYEEKKNDNNNKISVITYYGMGGIGKSTLLRKLVEEVKEKYADAKYAFLDFEKLDSFNNDILELLRYVEGNLKGKYNFTFPLFDLVSYTYEVKMGKNATKPELSSIFDENNELSFLKDVITEIPLIGTITKVIYYSDKAKNILQNRLENNKLKTQLGNIDNMEASEIYDNLPYYFALDLKNNVEKLEYPFVFFIDTYEKLVNELENRNALDKDLFLRGENGLILNIPNTIWVIAGREKLKWEERDKEWKDSIDQHLLGNLSEADTKYFLNKAGIIDEKLVKDIYNLTYGAPKYLDMCVDTYTSLVNQNKVPTIDDFGKDTTELQKRYLIYMDDQEKDFATMLAFLPSWTDENIEDISKTILGTFSHSLYEKVKNFSFIQKEGDVYSINSSFKDIIVANTSEPLRNKYFKILENYIDKEIEEIVLEDKKQEKQEKTVKIDNYNSKKNFKNIILNLSKEITKASSETEFIDKAKFLISKIEEYEKKYDEKITIPDIEDYLRSKFEYSSTEEFKILQGFKSLDLADVINNYNMAQNPYHIKRFIENWNMSIDFIDQYKNLTEIVEKEFEKNNIYYIRTLALCGHAFIKFVENIKLMNKLLDEYDGEKNKLYIKTLFDTIGIAKSHNVTRLKEGISLLEKHPEYITMNMIKCIFNACYFNRNEEEKEVIINYIYSVQYIINETLDTDIINGFYKVTRDYLGGTNNSGVVLVDNPKIRAKALEILKNIINRFEEIYGKDHELTSEAEVFLLKENVIYMPSLYTEIMDKYIDKYGYDSKITKQAFIILTYEVANMSKKLQEDKRKILMEYTIKYGTLLVNENNGRSDINTEMTVALYWVFEKINACIENNDERLNNIKEGYKVLYKTLKYYNDKEKLLRYSCGFYYEYFEHYIDEYLKDPDNKYDMISAEVVRCLNSILDNRYKNPALEKLTIKMFMISMYSHINHLFDIVKKEWGEKNVEELMASKTESSVESLERKYATYGGSMKSYIHIIIMYKLLREILPNIDGLYEEYYDTIEKKKNKENYSYKNFKYINKCSKLNKYLVYYRDAFKKLINNDVNYYIWDYYTGVLGIIYGTKSDLLKFENHKKLIKKFKNNEMLELLNGTKNIIVDIRQIDDNNKDWDIFA